MAMHGGVTPIIGTFFVFSDYCRPAMRLAALSEAKVIYAFTPRLGRASAPTDPRTNRRTTRVAAGHAGPARDPPGRRQRNGARACASRSTATGPPLLILSRQDLPVLDGTADAYADVAKGAYVLRDAADAAITLIGTGSEVELCLGAADVLAGRRGFACRVVSMPSWELFAAQPEDYRDERARRPAADPRGRSRSQLRLGAVGR